MALSKETQAELKLLGRRANRRLERATEGQRKALEYIIRGYHTIGEKGSLRFSQGKAKTEAEARARLRELRSFLEGDPEAREGELPISTRAGWEAAKSLAVKNANETLKYKYRNIKGIYNITDDELATILEETGGEKSMAFYSSLENVIIKKNRRRKANRDKPLSAKELGKAIADRKTDLQRIKELYGRPGK